MKKFVTNSYHSYWIFVKASHINGTARLGEWSKPLVLGTNLVSRRKFKSFNVHDSFLLQYKKKTILFCYYGKFYLNFHHFSVALNYYFLFKAGKFLFWIIIEFIKQKYAKQCSIG